MDMHKKTSMDVTFQSVDPELLELLTGSQGEVGVGRVGIEIHTRIKRTFWQWLRRKPIKYKTVFIPSARITFDRSE